MLKVDKAIAYPPQDVTVKGVSHASIVEDDLIARLMSFPNVLITSHQGFFTNEALEQIASTTISNIHAVETGKPTENEVI